MTGEIVNLSKRRRTYGSEAIAALNQAVAAAKDKPHPVSVAVVLLAPDGTAQHFYALGPNSFALLGAVEMMKTDIAWTMEPESSDE